MKIKQYSIAIIDKNTGNLLNGFYLSCTEDELYKQLSFLPESKQEDIFIVAIPRTAKQIEKSLKQSYKLISTFSIKENNHAN